MPHRNPILIDCRLIAAVSPLSRSSSVPHGEQRLIFTQVLLHLAEKLSLCDVTKSDPSQFSDKQTARLTFIFA